MLRLSHESEQKGKPLFMGILNSKVCKFHNASLWFTERSTQNARKCIFEAERLSSPFFWPQALENEETSISDDGNLLSSMYNPERSLSLALFMLIFHFYWTFSAIQMEFSLHRVQQSNKTHSNKCTFSRESIFEIIEI